MATAARPASKGTSFLMTKTSVQNVDLQEVQVIKVSLDYSLPIQPNERRNEIVRRTVRPSGLTLISLHCSVPLALTAVSSLQGGFSFVSEEAFRSGNVCTCIKRTWPNVRLKSVMRSRFGESAGPGCG